MKVEDTKRDIILAKMKKIDIILSSRPWDDYSQSLQIEYDRLLKDLREMK